MKMGGTSLLEHAFTRANLSGYPTFVMTPDDEVVAFCNEKRIPVLQARPVTRSLARELAEVVARRKPDILVVTTGDCLAVDGAYIRAVVGRVTLSGEGYFDLRLKGGEVRALPRRAFEQMDLDALSDYDHEHGVTWFNDKVKRDEQSDNSPNLSVDTVEDLNYANARFKTITQWAPGVDLAKEWTKHGSVRKD